MLIAAIIIGLITAYYFGLKPGGYAAAIAAGLFFIAAVIPRLAWPIYGVVAIAVAGILVIGPRAERPDSNKKYVRWARRAAKRLWRKL